MLHNTSSTSPAQVEKPHTYAIHVIFKDIRRKELTLKAIARIEESESFFTLKYRGTENVIKIAKDSVLSMESIEMM